MGAHLRVCENLLPAPNSPRGWQCQALEGPELIGSRSPGPGLPLGRENGRLRVNGVEGREQVPLGRDPSIERDLELPTAQVAFDSLLTSQRGTLEVRVPGKHSQRAASMKDTQEPCTASGDTINSSWEDSQAGQGPICWVPAPLPLPLSQKQPSTGTCYSC